MPPADLSSVPLVALSTSTKECISTLLNPPKCIPSDKGYPRDWRGLADLLDHKGKDIPNISSKQDPCGYILDNLQKKEPGYTIKDFQNFLEKLERWDIIDDTQALMENDAQSYKERLERGSESAEVLHNNVDNQILTYDDPNRLAQGLGTQHYDALLLYADEDTDFATIIRKKLEDEFGLKLCIKDRDLVAGIEFDHSATMQIISERCNRLIIVVSPSFFNSPANQFFLKYAQAVGIDKRQRKIIPCIYKRCTVPPELTYYFSLDYNRAGPLFDFWAKLRDSVKISATPVNSAVTSIATASPRCFPKVEESEPCEKEIAAEERKACCESKAERRYEVKEEFREPCKLTAKDVVENCGLDNESVIHKKCKGTPKRFRMKSFMPKKESREKCSMTELSTCESMPSLSSSTCDSTYSSVTSKRKKGFVNKCVTKIRTMVKS